MSELSKVIQEMADDSTDSGMSFSDYVLEPFRGVGQGAYKFGQSIASIADYGVESFGGDLVADEYLRDEGIPEWLRTRSFAGGFVSGATQFALGFSGFGLGRAGAAIGNTIRGTKLLSELAGTTGAVGTVTKALTSPYVGRYVIGGALTDAVAFQGTDGRLSDLLVEMGGVGDNAVTRWLASNEDDSWAEGRFKNAVEGIVSGLAFDGALKSLAFAARPVTDAVQGRLKTKAIEGLQAAGKINETEAAILGSAKTAAEVRRGLEGLRTLFQGPVQAGEVAGDFLERFSELRSVNLDDIEIKSRDQFVSQLTDIVGKTSVKADAGSVVEASMRLTMDPLAKLYAAARGLSVDEAYEKILPSLAGTKPGGDVLYMTAYHGTPHRFQPESLIEVNGQRQYVPMGQEPAGSTVVGQFPLGRFDMGKVGTGEGAQAFGYGLYFADDKKVADYYRSRSGDFDLIDKDGKVLPFDLTIKGDAEDRAYSVLKTFDGDIDESIRYLEENQAGTSNGRSTGSAVDVLRKWKEDGIRLMENKPGPLYTVDLKPSEDEYLLWDKPLSQQSEKVKASLAAVGIDLNSSGRDPLGSEIYDQLAQTNAKEAGSNLPEWMRGQKLPSPRAASDLLRGKGVRGVKYLDAASRDIGKGTHNYVIFDDADISILKASDTLDQALPETRAVRGWIEFLQDDKAVIGLTKAADESTLLHELSHRFQRSLGVVSPQVDDQLKGILGLSGEWNTEAGRAAAEKFARAFEKYAATGEGGPDDAMIAAFGMFKTWLSDIYQNVVNSPLREEFDPKLLKFIDTIVGGQQFRAKNLTSVERAVEEAVSDLTNDATEAIKRGDDPVEALAEGVVYHVNFDRLIGESRLKETMLALAQSLSSKRDAMVGGQRSLAETLDYAATNYLGFPAKAMQELRAQAKGTEHLDSLVVAGRAMTLGILRKLQNLSNDILRYQPGEVPETLVEAWESGMKVRDELHLMTQTVQTNAARVVSGGRLFVGAAELTPESLLADRLAGATSNQRAASSAASRTADQLEKAGNSAAADRVRKKAKVRVDGVSGDLAKSGPTRAPGGSGNAPAVSSGQPGTPKPDAPKGPPVGSVPGQAPKAGGDQKLDPSGRKIRDEMLAEMGVPAPKDGPDTPKADTGKTPSGEAAPEKPKRRRGTPDEERLAKVEKDRDVIEVARILRDSRKTGVDADKLVRSRTKAKELGVGHAFLEYYKAAIMSGLPTLAINGISGGFNTVMQQAARFVGAASKLDVQEMKFSARLAQQTFGAFFDLFKYSSLDAQGVQGPKGFGAVWRAIKDENPVLTANAGFEVQRAIRAETFGLKNTQAAGKAVNLLGGVVRLPFRVNQGMEEAWKQLNYLGYIRTKAITAAEQALEGVPPGEYEKAMSAYVENYIRDAFDFSGGAALDPALAKEKGFLHNDAKQFAESVTYTQDLVYGIGKTLSEAKGKHPWLDLLVPFVKAPTNLFRQVINLTPGLNLLQASYQKRFMSKTADEAMRARGEMLIGLGIWGTALYMASTGQITGTGPLNPDERRNLEATGWRPFSIVLEREDGKKEYIEYRRLDPFSSILGLAVDFSEAAAYLRDDEADTFSRAALLSVANNLTAKTYLTGLADAMKAIAQPDRNAGTYLRNRLSALVPNIIARGSSATDDSMREVRSIMDAFRRRIPGLSETLPPRRDIFGEAITPSAGYVPFTSPEKQGPVAGFLGRYASPAQFSSQVDDAAKQEIANLRYGFSAPATRIGDVDLTTFRNEKGQTAHDRYQEMLADGTVTINGRKLKDEVLRLINTEAYKRLPEPSGPSDRANQRVKAVSGTLDRYRSLARRRLMKEFPELQQAMLAAQQSR